MKIIEIGNIGKTGEGNPVSGIIIAASREELSALPFNPYMAEVEVRKVESPKEEGKGNGK